MKALSIRQPWAWAILHAGKRLENRDWKGCAYRGPILIHAAKSVGNIDDFDGAADSVLAVIGRTERFGPAGRRFDRDFSVKNRFSDQVFVPGASMPRGGIVGRARISGVIRNDAELSYGEETPTLRGQRAWWVGGFALVLADVEPLPFVPWVGALGLFDVPEDYATRRPCIDCKKPTDAGPCPGCGVIVCQICAEREGAFCCDGLGAEPVR